LPGVALLAAAKSATSVVLLVDVTVTVIPLPALTVPPASPAPVIVTEEVVPPWIPREGEILSILGLTVAVGVT